MITILGGKVTRAAVSSRCAASIVLLEWRSTIQDDWHSGFFVCGRCALRRPVPGHTCGLYAEPDDANQLEGGRLRSNEDRDELTPPEDMTRWHINTCLPTTTAIVELARHDQIPLSEAHCRLLRYGAIISKVMRVAESYSDGEFVISIPDGVDRVVLIRRRTPGRRWWHVRTPRFTLERLLFPAEHHGDEHLVVEGPTPEP